MLPFSRRTALLTAALLALSAPAFAQDKPASPDELQPYRDLLAKADSPEASPAGAPGAPAGLDPWSSFGLLFFGTALVCMGGYGVMRHQNPGLKRFDEDLHHLKTLKLGTNHQVSVVAVHGETYVLGLSQGNIQLLTKLEEPEGEPESLPAEPSVAPAPLRPRHAPTPRPKPARMRQADSSPSIPVLTEHSGLFEGFEDMDPGLFEADEPEAPRAQAPPEPMAKSRPRDESLESDSVLIALRAFKEQSERM